MQVCVIIQIHTIVQLGELKDHVYHLRLVRARKAVVLFSVEDSLGALIYHLWADWVRCVVQLWLEVSMLLRHDQNRPEIFDSLVLMSV